MADGLSEILVDVVDVVLEGSGIQEKFLGITLFALVPNTTEFMNAISFAINGNIALRCVACPFFPCSRAENSLIAWKLAPHTRCKFVSSRFPLWWHSRHGMTRVT